MVPRRSRRRYTRLACNRANKHIGFQPRVRSSTTVPDSHDGDAERQPSQKQIRSLATPWPTRNEAARAIRMSDPAEFVGRRPVRTANRSIGFSQRRRFGSLDRLGANATVRLLSHVMQTPSASSTLSFQKRAKRFPCSGFAAIDANAATRRQHRHRIVRARGLESSNLRLSRRTPLSQASIKKPAGNGSIPQPKNA